MIITVLAESSRFIPFFKIEGQMMEVKGVVEEEEEEHSIDDLRNRRRYWELKEEVEDN